MYFYLRLLTISDRLQCVLQCRYHYLRTSRMFIVKVLGFKEFYGLDICIIEVFLGFKA